MSLRRLLLRSALFALLACGLLGCDDNPSKPAGDDDPIAPPTAYIPGGSFVMGDGTSYGGEDEHHVTLTHPFRLGRYEVTNREYLEAVQWAYDNGLVTVTSWSVHDKLDGSTEDLLILGCFGNEIAFADSGFHLGDAGHGINPDHPVKMVTWFGAARYCDWLSLRAGLPRAYEHDGGWRCNGGDPYGATGYRLPTDAEWEYAARYDDDRIYPWGDEPPDYGRASYHRVVGWTSPIGSYPGAPSIGGDPLYDLAGNAWEWCDDLWGRHLGTAPRTDPTGPDSSLGRVIRGGAWDSITHLLTCAYRQPYHQDGAYYTVGFRIARTVE